MPESPTLRVNEIFCSIQGEGYHTGMPATFVRFSGCNLDCDFCDTDHSYSMDKTVDEIMEMVPKDICAVVLTGGEPLIQDVGALAKALKDRHHHIHLETNGSQDYKVEQFKFAYGAWITVSPKYQQMPSLETLAYASEIKWVVQDVEDIVRAGNWYELLWKKFTEGTFREKYIRMPWFYLQPASLDKEATKLCVDACITFPRRYRLSAQVHRLIGVR